MPVIEESVVLHREPDIVFDYIANPTNLPVWDSSVVDAEQISDGPPRLGTRARGTSKIMGRRFHWTTEATEFDPPHRVVNTAVEGPMKFAVALILEPVDGGTKLTYHVDAESGLGGVFGKLADPLIERAQGRTIRANLESLAELLADHPAG
ncbi:SRPBCC family protein [Arthrobacter rhizosphaerae]|uniref:SRPBCC family protein n=1 Tax=Arthrobacter rhizosphaerae TaxID=2855490 RepID=UPI001FF4F0C4|nr:SRPBCC family protein [Arthrobacter rhizosphaerae]